MLGIGCTKMEKIGKLLTGHRQADGVRGLKERHSSKVLESPRRETELLLWMVGLGLRSSV